MNPFLHAMVVRPAATVFRSRFVRFAGQVALATGLVLGAAGTAAAAVDANVASQAELESVRGIGPRTAEMILKEREKGGAFKSFEDLSGRVRGLGTKRAQMLKEAGLTVGAAAAPAVAAASPAAAANTPKPAGVKRN